jgi:hypothetical protein
MVGVLQVVGIIYILLMLYLTFLFYKRNNYNFQSFLFWIVIWVFGALLLAFPESTSLLTQTLQVARTIDFYLIVGLMFFSVICFLNYATVKRNEQRMEELVRQVALKRRK